jgi:SLOG cluster2/CHAT domain
MIAQTYSPPLTVHVFWSREGSHALRYQVGRALYEFLWRPLDGNVVVKPGVGIPVRIGFHAAHVATAAKEAAADLGLERPCLVAVPLLDSDGRADSTFCDAIDALWEVGGENGWPRVLMLPVLLDSSWSVPDHIAPCRAAARVAAADKPERAVEEVGIGICHFLMNRAKPTSRRRVRIFVSHAKHDLPETSHLAERLRDHINGTELKTFFDASEQLDEAQQDAVFLSLRTDAYSESPYCLDEVLTAKRRGVPIVCVHALSETERRSLTYGGNSFTYVSRNREDELRTITAICLQAWLRHLHFHHSAPAIFRMRNLPLEPRYLSRPPELIDFAQSLLPREAATLVVYPDPPLPQAEAAVLRSAYPKVRLATPTTLHRELLRRVAAPALDGWRIALSLSESPDIPKIESLAEEHSARETRGLTDKHLQDAITYLTASLVGAGAELGYGGNLSKKGFTMLLSNVIAAHKRTTKTSRELLFNYVAASLWKREEAEEIAARFIKVESAGTTELPAPVKIALELTAMRRRMAADCHARVILGGTTSGYAGRILGVAEEAWWHLQESKPVYVAAGFGGGAGLVGQALAGDLAHFPTEAVMRQGKESYRGFSEAFDREALRLGFVPPPNLDEVWAFFAESGRGFFHGHGASEEKLWSNGLTVAENRRLLASVYPEEVSSLVLRGLLRLRDRQRATGAAPLKVMLFRGSIIDVPDVDSYAVPLLRGAPLRGADGALDAAMDGAIRRHLERQTNKDIVSVKSGRLPGDYVILQTVGDLAEVAPGDAQGERGWLLERVARGMAELVEHARTLGLDSPALVPFASNLGLDVRDSVCAMLSGLLEANAGTHLNNVALCELDPTRYADIIKLKEEIEALTPNAAAPSELQDFVGKVQFTELRSEPGLLARASTPSAILLDVRRQDNSLIVHARAPGSGTAVPLEQMTVDWARVMRLTHAFGYGQPPDFDMQPVIGTELANAVLLAQAREALAANRATPIDVLHDVEAAAIPFELLCLSAPPDPTPRWPALEGGLRRCLLTHNIPRRRAIHSRGLRLRLLLIADPTDDLPEASEEARKIREAFAGRGDVFIDPLIGSTQATYDNVLWKIGTQHFEAVHFAGHAEFNARDPSKSGLRLAHDQLLTGHAISDAKLDHLPALVVPNACEAGRVRARAPEPAPGEQATRDASLAETIIGAGIGGFIGNLWKVEDQAAALFSVSLYGDLSGGHTLGEAFLAARRKLYEKKLRDWPNYMLFGQADLRL